MNIHKSFEQLISTENESAGHLGIFYLSWHFQESAQTSRISSLQKQWRIFIKQKTDCVFKSAIPLESLEWMNEDLFIYMCLPSGRQQQLEGWLLEIAHKYTAEWEQQFKGELCLEEKCLLPGKLHAGIAVVATENFLTDRLLRYEAMKKAIIHGQSAGSMERSLRRKAIDHLLEKRQIQPVYQPIMSLQNDEVFGYEALARTVDRKWFEGPMELFLFAEQEGLTYALDRLAREKAIDECKALKQEQKLFINVMAKIMEAPSFSPGQTLSMLEQHQLSPHNVVFEITERSSIEDFGTVKRVLEHYRSQGYQIAIDDVGAGYSSLQSIVELRPDYLKVDRSIIQNIHLDEMKEHILHTLIDLAVKMGISVIAEGIELMEELEKVRKMGVHYAQGYLLGRPAAFQTI